MSYNKDVPLQVKEVTHQKTTEKNIQDSCYSDDCNNYTLIQDWREGSHLLV